MTILLEEPLKVTSLGNPKMFHATQQTKTISRTLPFGSTLFNFLGTIFIMFSTALETFWEL